MRVLLPEKPHDAVVDVAGGLFAHRSIRQDLHAVGADGDVHLVADRVIVLTGAAILPLQRLPPLAM